MEKKIFCENYKDYQIYRRLNYPFDFFDVMKNDKIIIANLLSKRSAKINITRLIKKGGGKNES